MLLIAAGGNGHKSDEMGSGDGQSAAKHADQHQHGDGVPPLSLWRPPDFCGFSRHGMLELIRLSGSAGATRYFTIVVIATDVFFFFPHTQLSFSVL